MRPSGDTTLLGPALREPARRALRSHAAAAALGLAAVAFAVLATPRGTDSAVVIARLAGVALPVGLGLLRLAQERDDRFALLLVGAGALFSVSTLAESGDSIVYSVGRVAAWLVEPALVYLMLAFPYGHLETSAERRLAWGVALMVAVLYLPTALLAAYPAPSPWSTCQTDCPANAFQVTAHGAGAVDDVIRPLRETLTVVFSAAVMVIVTRRALRVGQITRRIVLPVAVFALVRTITLGVYFADRRAGTASIVVVALTLPALTVAFASGLLANRLFIADALEQLTRRLSARPTRRQLREALAAALRDPALKVCFRAPDRDGWVDETGWPEDPEPGPGRAVTEVSNGEEKLAAIDHDADLLRDRALLEGLTSYVLTALENRHLIARLQSSLEELRESRARLVSVADQERRKIERDLHDGAQQRLVALQVKVELLAERFDAESPESARRVRALEDEIAATLDEVRRFSRGIYPPLLADRGLGDALHAVARKSVIPTTVDVRLRRRYPRDLESAVYFACLEALQNATKHAHGATGVTIAVSGNGELRFEVTDDGAGFDPEAVSLGAGLTNLRDRVSAVGGTLEITSRPRAGTRIAGSVPVGVH